MGETRDERRLTTILAADVVGYSRLMGDGMLVEFASVVNAVQCAIELQRAMEARNAALPDPRRMQLRIGINLGDVIIEGDDLYGDGVNLAARLEGLAEP